MAYCRTALTTQAVKYFKNATRVKKYDTGHDFLKSLWCYSTKMHPLDPGYANLETSYTDYKTDSTISQQNLESNMKTVVKMMVKDCFDEYLHENPEMQKLNTLRIHPVISKITIATPENFDSELFAGLKTYCDYLGLTIEKTSDSIADLDSNGVPLYLWTDDNSKNTGIIHCRSRDTGYSYQANILRMKKLLYTFASDYGPFKHFQNEHEWREFQTSVQQMPAMISENEAFGDPCLKIAFQHLESEKMRKREVQMSTKIEDIISKPTTEAESVDENEEKRQLAEAAASLKQEFY